MKSLDLFLPKIHQFAPGVADPIAYEWLREAAIEFCERTRMWRNFDSYQVAGIFPGDVRAPGGAVIHEIEQVAFNGIELTSKTPAELDLQYPEWRVGRVRGNPQYFTQLEADTIALAPLAAGSVTAWLVLKPSQGATTLPDFIADQHRQVIADGALGRILAMPGKDWTNLQLAAASSAAFQAKLVKLSNRGSAGQQRAHARSKPSVY